MKCNAEQNIQNQLIDNLRTQVLVCYEIIEECFFKKLSEKYNLDEIVNNDNKQLIQEEFDKYYNELDNYKKYIYKIEFDKNGGENNECKDNSEG